MSAKKALALCLVVMARQLLCWAERVADGLFSTPEEEALVRALNMTVDEIEFSHLTTNGLRVAGICYVGELVQLKERDLAANNIGRRSLREIKLTLGAMSPELGLGMRFPDWQPPAAQ